MATIVMTLTDTPDGVAIHSNFLPRVGLPCTPAQGFSLEAINRCHKQWGQITRHSDGVDIDAVHQRLQAAEAKPASPAFYE